MGHTRRTASGCGSGQPATTPVVSESATRRPGGARRRDNDGRWPEAAGRLAWERPRDEGLWGPITRTHARRPIPAATKALSGRRHAASGQDVRNRDFADLDTIDHHAQHMAGGQDLVLPIAARSWVGVGLDLAIDQVHEPGNRDAAGGMDLGHRPVVVHARVRHLDDQGRCRPVRGTAPGRRAGCPARRRCRDAAR